MTTFGITLISTMIIAIIVFLVIIRFKMWLSFSQIISLVGLTLTVGVIINILLMMVNGYNNHYFSEYENPVSIHVNYYQNIDIDQTFNAILTYENGEKLELNYSHQHANFSTEYKQLSLTDIDGKQVYYTKDLMLINRLPEKIKNKIRTETKIIIENN